MTSNNIVGQRAVRNCSNKRAAVHGFLKTRGARFAKDSHGNVAVIFAIALLPVMTAVGAAVDFTRGSSTKTAMQAALDSAALNVVKDAGTLTSSQLTSKAADVFTAVFNRPEAKNISVVAQFESQTATLTLNGSAAVPTTFMGMLGVNSMQISALSKARSNGQAGACVIALDKDASSAFKVSGAGTVSVPNCGIYVNSSSGSALYQSGSGWIKAKSIYVVGGATSGNYTPQPKVKQPVAADPLANIPEPTVPSFCTYKDYKFANAGTIPGGSVYCGEIKLNASMIFGEGIHYFKGATVTTVGNVKITGQDVMLYFDDTSTWDSRGTGNVQLKAPQSGTYMGIAMFASRKGNLSTFKLAGGKDYFINGSLYLPAMQLELYGDTQLTSDSKSGYVIARRFYYQGQSNFSFDSYGGAVPSALASASTTLVQ